jgi:hypothetical protein
MLMSETKDWLKLIIGAIIVLAFLGFVIVNVTDLWLGLVFCFIICVYIILISIMLNFVKPQLRWIILITASFVFVSFVIAMQKWAPEFWQRVVNVLGLLR